MYRPGLFGKMPAVGDFVGRGFSGGLRDALDRLLQSVLASAYSERTPDRIESTAQPIAVAIRPGGIAETGFAGCVMPSIDKIGRFFPLCLGIEVPAEEGSQINWLSLDLATTLCRLAYVAQSERLSPDDLVKRLPSQDEWWRLQHEEAPFSRAIELTVPATPISLTQFAFEGPEQSMTPANQALCSRLAVNSQALGAIVVPDSHFEFFFADRNMLNWSSYAAAFDGRWAYWGWVVQEVHRDGEDTLGLVTLPPRLDDDEATVIVNKGD